MKDPPERIRQLEDRCEALDKALEEIRQVVSLPKTTLPAVKRTVGRILVATRDRKSKPPE